MSKPTYHDLEHIIAELRAELSVCQNNTEKFRIDLEKSQSSLVSETKRKEVLDKEKSILAEKSRIDGLTTLYNHQYIMDRCQFEFARSIRYGTSLTCIMIDIDHFKKVNDTYGHQFGDFVLREIASILKQYSRVVDICGRYGGEEFMVLVSRSEEKAFEYISRFHQIIESHTFAFENHSTKITISAGIAEQKKDVKSYSELIARADEALYDAKEGGRNLIRIWSQPPDDEVVLDSGGVSDLKKKFNDLSSQMKETYLQSTNALLKAIDARDHYTLLHSQQVSLFAVSIATELKLSASDINVIKNAGLLHDIGKIGIEEKILIKKTPLTDAEFQLLKRHSLIGVEILKDISFLENEIPFILHHHERFDGSGYPHGLKGRSIPLGAKILALADSYSAMVTDRQFKQKKSLDEAIDELISQKGKQFDPEMTDVFVKLLRKS